MPPYAHALPLHQDWCGCQAVELCDGVSIKSPQWRVCCVLMRGACKLYPSPDYGYDHDMLLTHQNRRPTVRTQSIHPFFYRMHHGHACEKDVYSALMCPHIANSDRFLPQSLDPFCSCVQPILLDPCVHRKGNLRQCRQGWSMVFAYVCMASGVEIVPP